MKIFKFLNSLLRGIKYLFIRFPVPAVMAMVAATISIFIIHDVENDAFGNILWTISLGFPLFISARLLAEKKDWKGKHYVFLFGGCFLFLVGYYFLLPEDILDSVRCTARSLLWGISFILLITFIPFLDKEEKSTLRFWNFNKKLLLNILQACFFAVTIFFGVAAAIWAVEELFNLDISGERYAELWTLCSLVIAPFLFLHNVPGNLQENLKKEYPKGLLIFTQYILLPLVALYFVILYSYTAKVAITWEWPKGILSYMIACFSFVGIVLHFFIYPRLKEMKWLEKFVKIFYLILIPQIAMYFMSIWMRVNQYGITEKRYFVVVGGLWLLGIALYFLISKKKDIRAISASLFAILLLSSFGPWGAFSVSERSQVKRLEELLQKNKMFDKEGMAKKTEEKVSYEDAKDISSIVRYLNRQHDFDQIQLWFEKDLENLESEKVNSFSIEEKVVELLGVEYVDQWEARNSDEKYFSFRVDYDKGFAVSGYDYLVPVSSNINDENNVLEKAGIGYKFYFLPKKKKFVIWHGEDNNVVDLSAYFDEVVDKNVGKNELVNGDEFFEMETDKIKFKIRFERISGNFNKSKNTYTLDSLGGNVLFKMKN